MFKFGTVKELSQFEGKIESDVYLAALRIVKILDDTYGADREVDNGDGGFVLVVENVQDLAAVSRQYIEVDANRHEAVSVVKCEKEAYISAFFIFNNEFGVDVFMPMSIAPKSIIETLKKDKKSH